MDTALLINLPRQEAERPPAVIAGLAGMCKSANIDYDVLDLNLAAIVTMPAAVRKDFEDYLVYYKKTSLYIDDFIDLVTKNLPDKHYKIIAVSLFTFETLRAANIVLPLLRQKYPKSKIVIGGHGATSPDNDNNGVPFYKHAIAKQIIDHYILGEADLAFQAYIKNPDDWISTDQKFFVDNLNQIPFACYDKILPSTYCKNGTMSAYVTGSRGCVRDCTFCDVGYIWTKYRFRTAEHLFNEILHHHLEYGVTLIEFTDNLINGSLSEFKKFNKLLVNAQSTYPSLKKLRYRGDYICRPKNQFSEEDFRTMVEAGGTDLVVGIESFSVPVRYHMGKKFDNNDVDFHLYCSGKYGVSNTFLMQVGYPTETLTDHQTNIEYLYRYQKYALSRVIKLIRWGFTTGILKGSPLDVKYREKLPLINELDNDEYLYGEFDWVNLSNAQLTFAERIRRRMELHKVTKLLRYPQPRVYDEFSFIFSQLSRTYNSRRVLEIVAK
jgi:radical SAM superfamily enzyme YgiQ (UPF0313 family)